MIASESLPMFFDGSKRFNFAFKLTPRDDSVTLPLHLCKLQLFVLPLNVDQSDSVFVVFIQVQLKDRIAFVEFLWLVDAVADYI